MLAEVVRPCRGNQARAARHWAYHRRPERAAPDGRWRETSAARAGPRGGRRTGDDRIDAGDAVGGAEGPRRPECPSAAGPPRGSGAEAPPV